MSYSQKQGPGGNTGGGGSSNQASQQAAKALAGIQQQMQNLVHGQNASQAGLNAFLQQQHFEMLKQQQQQLLLSNPQLQQRFQQQMQQSKDRGEPLALTRTPAAADLLNKTYQQHHQQQSNGSNGPASSLASVNQQIQQMQAANLMQQLHAYQLQFQQQQQQQQQQQGHHQQPQSTHHQQQSSHQHQPKSHAQSALSAAAMQTTKQQHNQQMQQSQFSQKYLPSAAHSKSVGGIPTPPPAIANQLKPPNLPPSTQITPIPSPQLSTTNNNLQTKGSSSSSAKQVAPSISLLPAKQPPVSLPNAPVAAHLHHHHQSKVPLSITSQYNNPSSKTPLVSAIPPPFPSHYQKMSNQPQQPQLQSNSNSLVAAVHELEPKQQISAVPLTKQHQPPQSSSVTISSCSPPKPTVANQIPPKPASLPPLMVVPAKETEDVTKVLPAAAVPPPPPPPPPPQPPSAQVSQQQLPMQVSEIKPNTPNSSPPITKQIEKDGNSSAEASPTRPIDEPDSPPNPEANNGNEEKVEARDDAPIVAVPETTKMPTYEAAVADLPAAIPLTVDKADDKNIKDNNTASTEIVEPLTIVTVAAANNSSQSTAIHDTTEDKANPVVEEESPASDVSTEMSKSDDAALNSSNNTTSGDEKHSSDEAKPEQYTEELKNSVPEIAEKPETVEEIEEPVVENVTNTSEEKESENTEEVEQLEPIKPEKKSERKLMEKSTEREKEKSLEKGAAKSNLSEKPISKSKMPRLSKTAAAAAISAEAHGEKSDKQKDKSKSEDVKSTPPAKVEKAETKRSQNKVKQQQQQSQATVTPHISPTTPSTPDDRKSKRHRLKTILYQSPLPELAFITKLSASEASNSPKPMSSEDKLIVFYKNEYMAVRNAEGSFFLCQTLQNVYRSSPRISIRWLSEDSKDETVFIPDFYDHTDIECVLTTVEMKKLEKGHLRLPNTEKTRIESILKRAIDVEKGILPRPDVTEENPDGLDISLYKDESQIEKKSASGGAAAGGSGKRSSLTRSLASKRNRSKPKSPSKKKKSSSPSKKKKKSDESDDDDIEEDGDESEGDTDKEYKPSRKRSIMSNTTQSTKPQRAQRSPLAKARAASPITPATSRSRKSVPQKTETPASASSVSNRNDRAAKRRAAESSTNVTPEVPAKKAVIASSSKTLKETPTATINAVEDLTTPSSQKFVHKASTSATSTKKNRPVVSTTPTATPSTPSTSGTRPTRSRK